MFQIQVSYLSADVLVTFLIAATKYLKKSPEKGFTLAQHRGSSGFRSVSHWSHSSQVAEGGCLLSSFYSVQSPTLRTGPLTSTNLTQEQLHGKAWRFVSWEIRDLVAQTISSSHHKWQCGKHSHQS